MRASFRSGSRRRPRGALVAPDKRPTNTRAVDERRLNGARMAPERRARGVARASHEPHVSDQDRSDQEERLQAPARDCALDRQAPACPMLRAPNEGKSGQ